MRRKIIGYVYLDNAKHCRLIIILTIIIVFVVVVIIIIRRGYWTGHFPSNLARGFSQSLTLDWSHGRCRVCWRWDFLGSAFGVCRRCRCGVLGFCGDDHCRRDVLGLYDGRIFRGAVRNRCVLDKSRGFGRRFGRRSKGLNVVQMQHFPENVVRSAGDNVKRSKRVD